MNNSATLEDQHGEVYEWEVCSRGCRNYLFGYHSRSCNLHTLADDRMEARIQSQLDESRGK